MKETTSVHLGRQQFIISVDAHRALRQYLAEIEEQPGMQPEVLMEVELRMAELLDEHGIKGDKVVLPADIDYLRQQLGEPGDFKDDAQSADGDEAEDSDTSDKSTAGDRQPKRFFRDPENAMFAGVASGLAAYTGLDTWIIRAIFIASTFASGAGVIIYILLWILAPEARTPSDRLKMQGKPVTVEGIKQLVERADIAGAGQRVGDAFGKGLAVVLESITKAIVAIVGTILSIVGVAAMLWIVFAGGYLLFHGGQVNDAIIFPFGAKEVAAVALTALTLLLIGLLLTVTGVSMASRRWRLPGWVVASLFGVLIVAGGLAAALGTASFDTVRARFDAMRQTQTRQLTAFKDLEIQGDGIKYHFQQDASYFIELSYLGRSDDTQTFKTTVNGDVLQIDSRDFTTGSGCSAMCLYSDRDLSVTIHAPGLESVKVRGGDTSLHFDDDVALPSMSLEATSNRDNDIDVSNARINRLSINNVEDCRPGTPSISVARGFRGMILNEMNIVDQDELFRRQSTENANRYNCVNPL